MTHHIDAYDWVMVPNVFGMGLVSDGGLFASKPYVCSSNYLCRMSNFKKGPWTDVADGLYWRFIRKHKDVLVRNPRMAMAVRNLERQSSGRLSTIFAAAEQFLAANTLTGR
jgi:deoxyribodipyrimidine photolyase-related protein